MQVMAEELRRRGHLATTASFAQTSFGHVNDIQLNLRERPTRLARALQLALFDTWAAVNYDIFHFFWGESLLTAFGRRHLDLPLLRRLGKTIIVHFRGLDLVDLPYFDYLSGVGEGRVLAEPPMSRPDQLNSLAAWRRYADALLVSEPDLLRIVPEAHLVQQALSLDGWQPQSRPASAEDGIIRIAHAPSMRRKKGTEFVIRAIDELVAEGHPVELVLIEKVRPADVKAMYETCDIGVDQVIYGWYGKVSVELMALGRPVVCYIDEDLRSYRPDMPIVNARPPTLVAALRDLVLDERRRRELGDAGRRYVATHHDVKRIVDECLAFYGL